MNNKAVKVICAISSAALIVASSLSSAAEVLLESQLSVNAQHDNNINLEVANKDSLYGEEVNPKAKLTLREQNWSSSINADLRFSDFNREGYASEDQYLDLAASRKGERYELGITGNVVNDTTRTSEEQDSGRYSNERHKLYSLAPTFTYLVTDKNQLKIQASWSKSDYENADYTGNESEAISAEWKYIIDEQLSLFLGANTSKVKFDEKTDLYAFYQISPTPPPLYEMVPVRQTINKETNSSGFQIGAGYKWNEKLSLSGRFGRSNTKNSYDVDTENNECGNPIWVYTKNCDINEASFNTKNSEAKITWQEERQAFNLRYSVTTRPTSDGYVLEYESVDLDWRYKLTETGNISFLTTWGDNTLIEQPDGVFGSSSVDRTYITSTLQYDHRLTEHWYLNTSIRYRYQARDVDNNEAEGLGGTVGVSYFFDKQQW